MAFKKGRLKTGGRKCGSLNKTTYEIQEITRQYGPAVIERLVRLADNRNGDVAIKAVKILLEYGFGKPREQIEMNMVDTSSRVVFYMPENGRTITTDISSD